MRAIRLRFALVCLFLGTGTVLAQTFGEITGEVRDPSGAVVAGATITLTNVGTNAARSTESNDVGVYAFPAVPPGQYTIKAEKPGFKTYTRAGIQIQVELRARLDIDMQVGQLAEVDGSLGGGCTAHQRERHGRHGHREQAHRGAAAERPQLSAAGRAGAQRELRIPQRRPGRLAAGRHPRRPEHLGRRPAHPLQPLHAGRRREHRPELQHLRGAAVDRRAAGIQGSDRRLSGRVRPRRHADQCLDQAGHERVSRHAVLVPPQREAGRQELRLHRARPPKDPFKWNQFGFTLGGPVWIPKLFNGKDKLFFMANYEWFRQRRQVQARFDCRRRPC